MARDSRRTSIATLAREGGPATEPDHRDEFEVVGRAGPVEFSSVPYVPAEAREDLLVVKEGSLFVCTRPDGDIWPGRVTGEGLYARDTRFLSELRLTLGGASPVLLSSSADARYAATVDATNPDLEARGRVVVPQQSINVNRVMLLNDRLYLRTSLRNFAVEALATELELAMAADFADMFEVRGKGIRSVRGHFLGPKHDERHARLAYEGEDGILRETVIEFDPEPRWLSVSAGRVSASWPIDLPRGGSSTVLVTVEPRTNKRGATRRPRLEEAQEENRLAYRRFEESCADIRTSNELYNRVVHASVKDMRALITPFSAKSNGEEDAEAVAAGIPWYVALFGRDSLVTCYSALMVNPDLARRTLFLLGDFQSQTDDAWRDAEPGKILHELRSGELARAGLIPHTPYYGTVDATPLFLMLAAAYYRWTADLETLRMLRPALDAALRWIDEFGDRDGDGFVEYERRSPGGLVQQGWKDSEDSIVHADGSRAEPPIALVEVQGYVYLAKLRIADVYDALGSADVANELRKQAAQLRAAFNEAYWVPEEGTYALALDGRKRQLKSVTSNPTHCLYCGIVAPDKAGALVERVMAPDMFSGWGIRTLSSKSPAYNPMGYHLGTVWPHDNALAAAGFKRYGYEREVLRTADAMFDVAARVPEFRLPELYCGFDRGHMDRPVAYPVACSPQAWAAAAPFMVLQAMLGISARAPEGVLTVNEPRLPDWLDHVELKNMRVGSSTVGLSFREDGDTTAFSLLEQEGQVRVVMSSAAPAAP